jgi:glycosyltransferase involved in cell wall biosynthesis
VSIWEKIIKKMKIALVHDYLKEYGGAERVLEAFLEIYPQATVYTSVFLPKFLGPHQARFSKYKIKSSFLQSIPFNHKLISPLRLVSPFVFKNFDLSSYDVIIVSQTGAYFPNLVQKGPLTKLICYTHTPPRYLYGYKTAREWKNNVVLRVLGETANHFLRIVDYNASQNVDFFVANSQEVAKRIKKFYRREATVIHPPVEMQVLGSRFQVSDRQRNYYLTGGRLARAKGVDVIIKAFNENKLPLKIFGRGFAGYEDELRKSAHKNIEFVGEVSDEQKFELMSGAKAFVFASYDEDFGITPVEAMGVGTPVIAYRSGGVQETVVEGKTGVFFDENTSKSLNQAIEKFEKNPLKSSDCLKQAEKFSKEIFVKKIREFVKLHS